MKHHKHFIILKLSLPIFGCFAIINCIKAIKLNGQNINNDENNNKYNKYIAKTTLYSLIITFITLLIIEIPEPQIYFEKNDSKNSNGKYMIIKTYPFVDSYYTTDGTNPEYGENIQNRL